MGGKSWELEKFFCMIASVYAEEGEESFLATNLALSSVVTSVDVWVATCNFVNRGEVSVNLVIHNVLKPYAVKRYCSEEELEMEKGKDISQIPLLLLEWKTLASIEV